MRYVWDRYDDYFGPGRVGGLASFLIPVVAEGLRGWDVATAPRVHRFAANSRFVAGRIARYYAREAEVLPPPVDTDFFTPGDARPGDYDLVVSALAPYKRLGLVLAAYRGGGRRLRVVGTGPEEASLREEASAEVEFLGRVDDVRLRDLYRGCRAVVMPGVEDFGIVPLEAMACGRPAVVFAEGGGPETVTPGRTGMVFSEATPESLRAALVSLDRQRFATLELRAQAEAHGPEVFARRMRSFVEQALESREARLREAPAW
jgi:glycosyltransferase involved in cell wall biosynthesis